jgi:signal transduction histidine kinase
VNADIRNVPSPTDSLASLAERIDGSLELIDREALKIVSGEVVLDPDATIGSIDLGSRVLRDVLSELMTVTSADQQRKPPELDLGRALREEAERLGRSHAAPLVLDLRVPAGLPAVATPEAALREIMRDLLSLCAAAAGRGGTLTIAARCEGDEVGLLLEAGGGEDPRDVRPVSLEDLVTTLSGRLHTERSDDGTFRACLVLPSTAAR